MQLPTRDRPGWVLPIILIPALALASCTTMKPTEPVVDTSFRSRSQESRVRYLVIHFTQLNFQRSLQVLTEGNVSSHYLVDVDPPVIYRLVDEDRRAWHAGRSFWQGDTNLNSSSIGIEIVNLGDDSQPGVSYAEYPTAQIDAVIGLVRDVARRHDIAPHRILGHSDIAPQRKTDPGPRFPWQRLAAEGLIPWPRESIVREALGRYLAALPNVSWFQEKLAAHGFEVARHGELDEATRRVIAAFQMKYRPGRHDGEPDAETAALLEAVTQPQGLEIRLADGSLTDYPPR